MHTGLSKVFWKDIHEAGQRGMWVFFFTANLLAPCSLIISDTYCLPINNIESTGKYHVLDLSAPGRSFSWGIDLRLTDWEKG